MSRTTIVLTEELQKQAKEFDINVSKVCRDAVTAAIEAVQLAQKAGDDFEMVTARAVTDPNRDPLDVALAEDVQFVGRLVYHDEYTNEFWYLTSGVRVALVDRDNNERLEWWDDVSVLPPGMARQALEQALGEVRTPTFLDI